MKVKKKIRASFKEQVELIAYKNVHTVCEESKCPNRYECSQEKIATFLIGGRLCTRSCSFCHIATGKPLPLNDFADKEVYDILYSIDMLGSKYVVITAVARDDDELGLANHFNNLTSLIAKKNVEVELLIPDFHAKKKYLDIIANSNPLVIAQNIETVNRLTKKIRPQAGYEQTLSVFQYLHNHYPKIILKSGLMIGLGETLDEIEELLLDLKNNYIDIVTIGQYMQPSKKQLNVAQIDTENIFEKLEKMVTDIGFLGYEVGPFVRSSYMASKTMESVKQKKQRI